MLNRLNELNEIRQYGIGEASLILGVSGQTLRNWENDGKIPKARRNGFKRARVYSACELEQLATWIKENYYCK